MEEASNQPPTKGGYEYMELGGEDIPLSTQFLNIVRDLQNELGNIGVGHEHLLKERTEQKMLIKDLIGKLIHKLLTQRKMRIKNIP